MAQQVHFTRCLQWRFPPRVRGMGLVYTARLSRACAHLGDARATRSLLHVRSPSLTGSVKGTYHGNRQTVVGRMPGSFRMKGR